MARRIKPAPPAVLRKKTIKEMLPVQFTQTELNDIGLQLAATHQRIGQITLEKKLANDRLKEDIEAATNHASRLATNRVNGFENRYVDCEMTYDFEKGMKRVVRLDTGEVVREEPMKDEERQLAFAVVEQSEEPEETAH
jgi:hypothetical protein